MEVENKLLELYFFLPNLPHFFLYIVSADGLDGEVVGRRTASSLPRGKDGTWRSRYVCFV